MVPEEPNPSGERLITKLLQFLEIWEGELVSGRSTLRLSPRALEYLTGRLSSLDELRGLKAAAPVEFLRGCVSNLDDYKRLERLTVLRTLTCITISPPNSPLRDPTPLQLSAFRSLTSLELRGCDVASCKPMGLDTLRPQLVNLRVTNSLEALSHLLRPGPGYALPVTPADSSYVWPSLVSLNCQGNAISSMDCTLTLLPALTSLNLRRNQITSIANLFACTSLTDLNLSCNSITDCQPLAECPSLQTVSLPWNAISSLEGLDALPVLRRLDLRGNRVRQLVQVALLASLPNLEELLLARNPITCVPGWRISVLACFLETYSRLTLDGEKPNAQEHRKVLGLMQRRAARKGFTSAHPQQFPRAKQQHQDQIHQHHQKHTLTPWPASSPASAAATTSDSALRLYNIDSPAQRVHAGRQQKSRARVVNFDSPRPSSTGKLMAARAAEQVGGGASPLPCSSSLHSGYSASERVHEADGQPSSSRGLEDAPLPRSIPNTAGPSPPTSLSSLWWDQMQAFVDHSSAFLPDGHHRAEKGQRQDRHWLGSPPRFQRSVMESVRLSSSGGIEDVLSYPAMSDSDSSLGDADHLS